MTIKELINQKIDNLSNSKQKKVFNFVNLLRQQQIKAENEVWNYFSQEEIKLDWGVYSCHFGITWEGIGEYAWAI